MIMEAKDIISKLNTALKSEVEAILVYTNTHAVCECPHLKLLAIETSFDEMRHAKILSELISDLDGKPALTSPDTRLIYDDDEEQLDHIEDLEEEAVKLYEELIAEIDDEEIVSELKKILADEKAHLKDIDELEEEWAEDDGDDDEEDDDKEEED